MSAHIVGYKVLYYNVFKFHHLKNPMLLNDEISSFSEPALSSGGLQGSVDPSQHVGPGRVAFEVLIRLLVYVGLSAVSMVPPHVCPYQNLNVFITIVLHTMKLR